MKKRVNKKKAPAKAKAYRKRRAPAKRRVARVPRMPTTIQGRSGQVTCSSALHTHRASAMIRGHKMLTPDSIYSFSSGFTQNNLSGSQTYWDQTHMSQATLRSIMTLIQNQQYVPAGVLPFGPVRGVIRGATEEYLLNNATTQSIEIDLYDIALKRDITASFNFVANGLSYTVSPFPSDYVNIGLLAQQGGSQASPPSPLPFYNLSSLPTDSRLFADYFKIVKKTRVFMSPGACHKHVVNIKTNKLLDEYLVPSTLAGVKGATTFLMAVMRGMPVWDGEDAGVKATTASCAIQVVRSQRIKYSYIADTSYTSLFGSSLSQIPSASQGFVSPLNGTVTNVEGVPAIS